VSSQPLSEMRTRDLPGSKGRPTLKIHNLTAICEPIVQKMWECPRFTNPWASISCYKDSCTSINFNGSVVWCVNVLYNGFFQINVDLNFT
jgi:hypothetical protein